MELAEQELQASAEEFRALEEAFAHFSRQTAQLREAYLELKGRAERINLELEAANLELTRKVRELDEANNFQRSILNSIPIAVVVTDLEGTIRTFNPAAERVWGVAAEEATGRHFRQVMQPHEGLLEAVLEGRCRQESRRRELDGAQRTSISSTACLVENSDGEPIGAVQLDRDITRLCALRLQVYEQGKLADLGKVAAGLAHEIRKPLNGVKGFASILQRRFDDDAQHAQYVANIMDAADRLNGMLSRLLDFARPDGVHLDTCDLSSSAERIAEFVRAEGRPASVGIVVNVPPDARRVTADADKLSQVLLNLVQNGCDAVEGEGTVRVEALPEGAGPERFVRVQVVDTGKGMSPEQVSRILEPFYTSKENGTGLGLSIVSRILELHGTRLEVESEPGRGTAMSFLLPAASSSEDR